MYKDLRKISFTTTLKSFLYKFLFCKKKKIKKKNY